jgi:2-polyprenyl-6-methoxyphenol hydroxylase-like FAD-dependent oxidoreductase
MKETAANSSRFVNDREVCYVPEHRTKKKALIIGAGIGGLSAAKALSSAGWEVQVFEKTQSLSNVGAGIVLAANAMKALARLGVDARVRSLGAPVKQADILAWNGDLLTRLPVEAQAARYGTYSYLIHRAELQATLAEGLPEHTIRYQACLCRVQQTEDCVTAEFEDGTTASGDLLIGADGIHSKVRELLETADLPYRYAGYTAFRGVANIHHNELRLEHGGGFELWGRGKRFGVSAIGQGRLFWFAAVNAPEEWRRSPGARKQIVLQLVEDSIPALTKVVSSTEEQNILQHDIYDRKPLSTWTKGRIALLGDAAHPMLPNLGQGGAQAMEDSLTLMSCLKYHDTDVVRALKAYEHARLPRTTRVVQASRRMARLVQLENPTLLSLRNGLLRSLPARMLMNQLDWILRHNP